MTLADKTKGRAGGRRQAAPAEERAAYEADAYSWALQQAAFLRAGRFDMIDALNIADEIDDVAKNEARATRSAIRLVLQHLLKWDLQPERRSRSWALTIREHRRGIERQLRENPGLSARRTMLTAEAYDDARDVAMRETGPQEAVVPATCPYSWEDITARPIDWPDQP